jgi:hypothetical protein
MHSLFLSHSSVDAALTAALSQRLRTAVEGVAFDSIIDYEKIPNLDILVDQEKLARGKFWPPQLNEWLARCHSGVVLLTEHAARSAWVLKETSIMEWRLDRDPSFRLFIARFPEVTDELLKENKYGALDLDRIHRIPVPAPGADTPDQYRERAAACIGDTLREQLKTAAPQKTVFDELVGTLGDLLEDLKTNTLRTIAERVRAAPPAWSAAGDPRREYIASHTRKVLNFLAPYWVDASAAIRLRLLSRSAAPRPACMNGACVADYTGLMYVRRAHFMSIQFVAPEVGGGDDGEGPDYIEQQICQWFRDRKIYTGSNETIRAKLTNMKAPVYVVLPDRLDNAALKELRNRFKRVTFIMPIGEKLVRDDTLEDVEWLEPEVDVEIEGQERDRFRLAVAFLENT